MLRYILVRIGQGIITLFVLVTLVFVLGRLIGNPVDLLIDPDATPEYREYLINKLGLDRPYYVQYVEYLSGLLQGDVGDSIAWSRPVAELFAERFPNTVKLALVAMTMAVVFGFTLGMVSGTHKGAAIDQISRAVSVIGMSAPNFWIGLMLMLIVGVQLRLLPVARMEGPASYILPALTLSFFTLAGLARLLRSTMIEVLDSEYVRLARIKGVSPNMVVWKHCMRNALIPVVTFAGIHFAAFLHGSVLVESVFAWPGVGRLIFGGISGRDYPLIQGCLLIVGAMVVVINLAVDVLYSYIDPRVRVAGGKT
jgi:ABC-type dipeptide/oligopeptide/nickel transport system permease component